MGSGNVSMSCSNSTGARVDIRVESGNGRWVSTDPLAELAIEPSVLESSESARAAVDELLWNRTARGMGSDLAAESTMAGAWCSAAFEGAEVLLDDLRGGAVEDSPMGRVAARTLAMYIELPKISDLLGRSPMQALARLQSIAVTRAGATEDDLSGVGRPRQDNTVADPLRLDTAVPAEEIGGRLRQLGQLLTSETSAPAIVVAGVAHAEVAVVQPFSSASGIVSRSLTRAVIRERGVDPDGWSMPEVGMRMMGRPSYVKALRAYASGTTEGVSIWLVHHARMVERGAQESVKWVEAQDGS